MHGCMCACVRQEVHSDKWEYESGQVCLGVCVFLRFRVEGTISVHMSQRARVCLCTCVCMHEAETQRESKMGIRVSARVCGCPCVFVFLSETDRYAYEFWCV